MRERSELARKGIARGRSVVALAYSGGVLFVAENPSRSLQKVSELYDRVGFAAVGRFNEFDNLRRGGIQFADTRGYAYDRRDVTGRQLANVYAQTLGTIFTEQAKPYEVELCVAEVAHYGETKPPELYRITYDGSIADEPHFVVMGGTTEPIITALNESYTENAGLSEAARIAIDALKAGAGNGGSEPRTLGPSTLEVAILDANRPRRAFRRITGSALEALLPEEDSDAEEAGRRLDPRHGGIGDGRGADSALAANLAAELAELVLPALGRRAGSIAHLYPPGTEPDTFEGRSYRRRRAISDGRHRLRPWARVLRHISGNQRPAVFGGPNGPPRGGLPVTSTPTGSTWSQRAGGSSACPIGGPE